jgi:hypothetical protein
MRTLVSSAELSLAPAAQRSGSARAAASSIPATLPSALARRGRRQAAGGG